MAGALDPIDPTQLVLRRDTVAWPLRTFTVHPMGAFGAVRKSPADGACAPKPSRGGGVPESGYPCKHYGADLSAPQGSPVYAPHDGWLLASVVADKQLNPPFVGYEPGVVLIAHDDVGDSLWDRLFVSWRDQFRYGPTFLRPNAMSARYSLLGHIEPIYQRTLPDDVYNPHEDHWRVLKDGTAIMLDNANALVRGRDRLREGGAVEPEQPSFQSRYVYAGDPIGFVSDRGHIHWEIRIAPLADHSGRQDPIDIWRTVYGMQFPADAKVATSSGGGGVALLALLALASGKKKRRR
jgi:hypothetical protein